MLTAMTQDGRQKMFASPFGKILPHEAHTHYSAAAAVKHDMMRISRDGLQFVYFARHAIRRRMEYGSGFLSL